MMSESDSSDSEVDFDIKVPTGSLKTHRGQRSDKVPMKRARPLPPSYENGEDSDSPSERIPQRVNKRPADVEWDASSSSSSSSDVYFEALSDIGEDIGRGGLNSSSENGLSVVSVERRPLSKRINLNDSNGLDDDTEDELVVENLDGLRANGAGRSRRRLSVRPNGNGSSVGSEVDSLNLSKDGSTISVNVSTASGPPPDARTLRKIYSTCIEMFKARKITLENAFELRFLDYLGEIIEMSDFDKADMLASGRVLETGGRIYVCRVEKTKISVMDLASTFNQKEKRKVWSIYEMDEENGEERDEVGSKKPKKKRKWIENKNLTEDESKISADFEDRISKAATRRQELKRKFNDLVEDDIEFEYNRYFFQSEDQDPVNKLEELTAYTQVTTVSDETINHAEIRSLEFLPFALVAEFDSWALNVWGLPIDSPSIHLENGDLIQFSLSNQEYVFPPDDLAYNPDERPLDYGPEDLEDHGNNASVNEDGVDIDKEGRPVIDPRKVRSLTEFYDMFSKIKSKYGWCGPAFVRPQFNFSQRKVNLRKRKPKRKCLDYKLAYWDSNKIFPNFSTQKPEKTELNEDVIQKWSAGGKPVLPYIGMESSDKECDDDFDILTADVQKTLNFIPNLFRYFIDPNRNILDRHGRDCEANEFDREEEEYIKAAGFDIEHHRDVDDFGTGRDCEGYDDDMQLNFDSQGSFEGLFDLPPSLEAVLMDTEGDLVSQTTDVGSIKFPKKPKPIDVASLKRSILRFLKDKLILDVEGRPTQDGETITTLATLVEEVCQAVDKKMLEHLSISIIIVVLLHVVAAKKLFMMPNPTTRSPLIICRGKLWNHIDHIPLPNNL